MVFSSFNTVGNIAYKKIEYTKTLFYDGTASVISSWQTIGDSYLYQSEIYNDNNVTNNSGAPYPFLYGCAISDDGNYILFGARRINSVTSALVSRGMMVSDNAGNSWSYIDLSNGYTVTQTSGSNSQLVVKDIVGSATGDVYYVWACGTGGGTGKIGPNSFFEYIYQWNSSNGSIRDINNWKRGTGAASSPFLPSTSGSFTPSFSFSYSCITTDACGNNLYILCNNNYNNNNPSGTGYPNGKLQLCYVTNAKTSLPSSYITKYDLSLNAGSITTNNPFWSKVSGNGKVLYFMTDARTVCATLLDSSGKSISNSILIAPVNSNVTFYLSMDNCCSISYDGTVFIFSGAPGVNGTSGSHYARISYTSSTITLITSTQGSLNIKSYRTATNSTIDYNSNMSYFQSVSMPQLPPKYPFVVIGGYSTYYGAGAVYDVSNTIFLAKDYTNVSLNGTGAAGIITYMNSAKTINIPGKYTIGSMVSSTGNFIYLLTIDKIDSASTSTFTGPINGYCIKISY